MPASLYLLQNAQLFDGADRDLSGPLAHACAPEKENLVVMNNAVSNSATATRFAPMGLKPVRKPPETNEPSIPPGGTVPRTSGKCHNVSSDGSASNKSA